MTAILLMANHRIGREKYKKQLVLGCFIIPVQLLKTWMLKEMNNGYYMQASFFILLGTISSYIIDSFLILH